MALQQKQIIDKIEIVENNILQVRQRTDIFDDSDSNHVIASSYHRLSFAPGESLEGQDAKVVAIANAVWTPEVIAEYKAQQANNILSGA